MSAAPDAYGAAIRYCLINLDVEGMMKVWKRMAPHLANQTASDALISMHIARCDMQTLDSRLQKYSADWLAERGFQKIDGKWVQGLQKPDVVAEAVGIAVRSKYPEIAERIKTAMRDALENERARGETDPLKQREAMQKARMDQRFKLRMA